MKPATSTTRSARSRVPPLTHTKFYARIASDGNAMFTFNLLDFLRRSGEGGKRRRRRGRRRKRKRTWLQAHASRHAAGVQGRPSNARSLTGDMSDDDQSDSEDHDCGDDDEDDDGGDDREDDDVRMCSLLRDRTSSSAEGLAVFELHT
eukprot:761767-Hanusia_phi.AAC.1